MIANWDRVGHRGGVEGRTGVVPPRVGLLTNYVQGCITFENHSGLLGTPAK